MATPRLASLFTVARGLRAGVLAVVFGAGVAVGAATRSPMEPTLPDASSSAVALTPPSGTVQDRSVAPDDRADVTTDTVADDSPTDRTSAASPQGGPPEVEVASAAPRATVGAHLRALTAELAHLRRRVVALEQLRTSVDGPTRVGDDRDEQARDAPPVLPVDTAQDRWVALVSAGTAGEQADAIIERQAQHALARLALRDRAVREGWADSERFREESARLRRERVELRDEVRDGVYDQYLFSTGMPNRVQVRSVIQGSVAERHGLLPGDIIEGYADESVFTPRELRDATTRGIPGDDVAVRIRRGEEVLEAWLPRGPIGIQLETIRVAPEP